MTHGIFDSNVTNTAAVSATGTNAADGIDATSDSGTAIVGNSTTGTGVFGGSESGTGVSGNSTAETGVLGSGPIGVTGSSHSIDGVGVLGFGATGVSGESDNGTGVSGESTNGTGVLARSANSIGLHAVGGGVTPATPPPISQVAILAEGGPNPGIYSSSNGDNSIEGHSTDKSGIYGESTNDLGVYGESINGTGILAQSHNGIGLRVVGGGAGLGISPSPFPQGGIVADGGPSTAVFAVCTGDAICIWGISDSGDGVLGNSAAGTGVVGAGGQFGVRGRSDGVNSVGVQGMSANGLAGRFFGNVDVQGKLTKSAGGFKIDHPLDPENKYLFHSFVESPDMLNVYSGNITTDANGDATIRLPDYFEALNQDFRYQLTVIGQFAHAIVAEEIRNNQFTIKTDQPNVRVSWQVTGVRKDHFANMHRILVEEDKLAEECGMYLHPKAYGKPESQSIEYAHEKQRKGP